MLKTGLEVIKKIESKGFKAYIVGGFIRDHYMKLHSDDIDVCTNAKQKDLIQIFPNAILPKEKYGAVTSFYKKIRFEITTFRKEIKYLNRRPIDIEYTDNLEEDINRRDFTVNTLCMDSKGNIIDTLGGIKDIDNKTIKVVGDINKKFFEDPLRILRAVRFATQLNFILEEDVKKGIIKNAKYLKNISYDRKKEELTRILINKNAKYGISIIKELKLDKHLEITVDNIVIIEDILGIFAQLNILDIYPFSRNERESILNIQSMIKKGSIDNKDIYVYGLYICQIAANILNISKKDLSIMEKNVSIKSIKDININAREISEILNRPLNSWVREVLNDLESNIVEGTLINKKKNIKEYIISKYGGKNE